jgi:protein-tyrosine kinase
MESIRQAVERAKRQAGAGTEPRGQAHSNFSQRTPEFGSTEYRVGGPIRDIVLDDLHLQSKRIISHTIADFRSRPFGMLRTQVLQSMDAKGWKTLAITSPTPACGKTLTALNLALSIARQPERSVLLVDLDFTKPQVAACLGLKCDDGVVGVLEGRTKQSDAIVRARVGNLQLMVFPTASSPSSSELISSRAMAAMLGSLKSEYRAETIIFDLPPMLAGDDVIAILPQIDCVLFVAAVGTTTVAEIKECSKHLQSTEVIRFVVNKVPETSTDYYYYY